MKKILIVDIETTNFLNKGGRIVEVGIVELDLDSGEKRVLFDEVCHEDGITRDECDTAWIIKNSNLTTEEIRTSKNLKILAKQINRILFNYPLGVTAYNSAFDFGFLESRGFVFQKKLPCPMLLSTNICRIPNRNGYKGFKWPNVMEAYKFFLPESNYIELHRGADDAFHEADIVLALYKMGKFKID